MFKNLSPESVGASSEKLLSFIKMLEDYNFSTHSILMARGEEIFLECYYAPFHKDYLHRQYSISKSFVTLAIGLLEAEGRISLDEPFMKYFPEYRNENVSDRFDETTIRDMLTMRSCMVDYGIWWGGEDRVAAYFTKPSHQIGGTNYSYDSAGAFMLGCIVEKITGKPYLEYVKEKVLSEMGFSAESYCMVAPGGHSHSDSGVMCTARDLLIYARLLMNRGVWNGKRYLSEEFVEAAVAKQADNNLGSSLALHKNHGYGYLIWKLPRDGFAFVGAATQLVICDPKTNFVFVINSENIYRDETVYAIIMHELYQYIIPTLGEPLSENADSLSALKEHVESAKLVSLEGGVKTNFDKIISGRKYILEDNANGIRYVKFTFKSDSGVMEFEDENGINRLPFGIGYNEFADFPGKKRISNVASQYVDGAYKCATSAIWCEEKKLHIMSQVIDDHLGNVHIVAGFKDDRVSISMVKHAQRILDNYNGNLVGKSE